MTSFSWQRAVIKVGSALIAPDGQGCSAQYLLPIANFISHSLRQGKEIILVSSGAVAAGRQYFQASQRATITEKQAMAAIGQTHMMQSWARFFDRPCAQVLLTMDDLHDRQRYVNIQNTLRELLAQQIIPIVNENDTVAINELKVGDNDNLAAYVALVAGADTLIICSDIDGLYTADPRQDANATLISSVKQVNNQLKSMAGGAGSTVGTGGMLTKLEAAERATNAGIQSLIVNGKIADNFAQLSNHICPGTYFNPQENFGSARSHWLRYTLRSKGQVSIDDGALRALTERGASLLPSGIEAVHGQFNAGDAVDIMYQQQVIAKGLVQYHHTELKQIKGHRSEEISQVLGYTLADEAIHRDNLILLNHSEEA